MKQDDIIEHSSKINSQEFEDHAENFHKSNLGSQIEAYVAGYIAKHFRKEFDLGVKTSEVAEILIETASSNLNQCKSLKKKLKKQDNLEDEKATIVVVLGKISLASKFIFSRKT